MRFLALGASLALIASAFVIAVAPAASAASIASVSAGFNHTCAITTSATVKCWGNNDYGQLGDGTTTASYLPVAVTGLSGVAAVSSGDRRTCALTNAGGVLCWGNIGDFGQGATWSSVPVPAPGLASGVRSVSVGAYGSCALMSDTTVKCWGANIRGELGDGTTTPHPTPTTVPGLSGAVQLAVGAVHACVLMDTGTVKCWGYNAYGQVGNGSFDANGVLVPTDVVGLSSVTSIAAGGYHNCAITTDGGTVCWGQNQVGQLGDGSTVNSAVPVPVSGLSGTVATFALGTYHSCVVTNAGGAMCWGANNTGNLGDGTTTNRSMPQDVPGLTSGVVSLSGGRGNTCALDSAAKTRCWGWNLYGQVGNGSTSPTFVLSPTVVSWFLAGFTVRCTGLVCDVSDASQDPGGEITGRTWSFGDGGTATGSSASHTYATGGTYTISLTDSDAAGTTGTASQAVTVTPWNLKATFAKIKSVNYAQLTWNAAATSSSTVDLYRNGVKIFTLSNNGAYSDVLTARKGTFSYVVCPTGNSTRCSNASSVTF